MAEVMCPACKQFKLHPDLVMNALSRKDNETYICNDCGTREALEELALLDQYSVMGGFVVKEKPKVDKKPNGVRKCWECGKYKPQSEMKVYMNRYVCCR